MTAHVIPIWKEAPFIRLVAPQIAGIALADCFQLEAGTGILLLLAGFAGVAGFSLFRLSIRFRYALVYGIFFNLLLGGFGAALIAWNDQSIEKDIVPRFWDRRSSMIVKIEEPAVARPHSWKASASIVSMSTVSSAVKLSSGIVLYFRMANGLSPPAYGQEIRIRKRPGPIRPIPGAGSFDYPRYCALRNIFFQVFLGPNDYQILEKHANPVQQWLYSVRSWVVSVLHACIPGRKEYGLAAALLVGYRDDLDRQLVQSYSNTGVVHVVAISGLHLGLIYGLLRIACKPLESRRAGKWLSVCIVLGGLWAFSLLAGGGPSVIRSAVMFTCLVVGKMIRRDSSVYNTLAASAFLLLCYNPHWLWDIGFQLSYAAVLGIVVFMKPIYHWVVLRNRIADQIWQLNAVTLSAQVLTAPVCVFYFHQFPLLFLITNFIAVPLSSLILLGEIGLCFLSPFDLPSRLVGWCLSRLLTFMNTCVETLGSFSFSSLTGLEISITQTIMLYVMIVAMAFWLMAEQRSAIFVTLLAAILFMAESLI